MQEFSEGNAPQPKKAWVLHPSTDWGYICAWYDNKAMGRPDGSWHAIEVLLNKINELNSRERCMAIWAIYRRHEEYETLHGAGRASFDKVVYDCRDSILELEWRVQEHQRLVERLDIPEALQEYL